MSTAKRTHRATDRNAGTKSEYTHPARFARRRRAGKVAGGRAAFQATPPVSWTQRSPTLEGWEEYQGRNRIPSVPSTLPGWTSLPAFQSGGVAEKRSTPGYFPSTPPACSCPGSRGSRCHAVNIVFALLLGAALLALPSCASQAETSTRAAEAAPVFLSVKAIKVEPTELQHKVEITGTLVSSVAVDLKTEHPGRLVSVLKEEGDYVRQGELVAQQDDSNPKLAVDQAEANLQTALAALERAQVMEQHARVEDERARNLLQSGGITDRDVQAAKTALKDSMAQIKLAEAQIGQARQALAQAQKRFADCRVVSPISGQVERKFLNQGTYVDGGAILYRLVDNSRLELDTNVAAAELARLKAGQAVLFTVSSYPEERFEGRLTTINPSVQSSNRSLLVKASVNNPSGRLKAGMFARGSIVTGRTADAVVVPGNAVWRRPNQAPFVYVVDQNQAHKREVKLGIEQAEGIEIISGLKPGDIVVSEQYLELADGSKVSPLL